MHNKKIIENLNLLGLLGLIGVSIFGYYFQFYNHELPCPLCLLQRLGILMAGFGLALNFRYGFKSSHYAISLLGMGFAMAVAVRQVFLHIVPGTGGYGSPFWGLHLYTWVFVLGVAWSLYIIGLLLFSRQFELFGAQPVGGFRITVKIILYVLFLLIVMNVITTFLQCGLHACVSDPVTYELLQKMQ